MAQERIAATLSHLNGAPSGHSVGEFHATAASTNRDDDIVIVSVCRTAVGKARKGVFKDTDVVDLLAPCFAKVIRDAGISAEQVDDIVVGTVLAPGGLRATEVRMAGFIAGFPKETCVKTVNRQCSSGLQAIADVAGAISQGYCRIGIAAGVESMSKNVMKFDNMEVPDSVKTTSGALHCLLPMGITSENVADQYGITRDDQDAMAAESHRRAAAAQKAGKFVDEIVPVTTTWKDPATGQIKSITVTQDEGIRESTTKEGLGKLRPAFRKGGSTTAGNASQVSDGAAAALIMKRSTARALGCRPLANFKTFAVAGVPPDVMGIGPAFAIPKALKQAGLGVADIGVYEINEAFASQATYSVNKVGIPMSKVNPNGGAIALGHPLGCTGVRMTATLLGEMRRQQARYGVVSMCIGTGMGAAGIFELEN